MVSYTMNPTKDSNERGHKTDVVVLVMRMLAFRAENLSVVYSARLPEWIDGTQNRSSTGLR
jgi:hypothetical protein